MQINTNNLVVDIDKVKPNGYNPKLDFRSNDGLLKEFEKIKESLRIAGQISPLIVREIEGDMYEIINGRHRWEGMKELGFTQCEIKNLGNIDFDTAVSRALLTEDTKIPIDNVELAGLLKQIVSDEKPIDYWSNLLPYESELIKSKIDLLDYNFENTDEEPSASLEHLTYLFKFQNETDLAKVKDYFEQFPNEERGQALAGLLG